MKIGGALRQFAPLDPRQDRPAQAPGDGAVGFDELGVFGLDRGARAGEAGKPPVPRGTGTQAPQEASGERPRDPSRAGLAGTAPTRPLPPDLQWPGADLPVFEYDRPAPAPRPSLPAPTGEMPAPTAEEEVAPLQADESRPPAPVRARHEPSTHKLVVAVEGDKLSLAVQAPPLDADGRALLRRLLRQILAERRLSVADFHLNGAPLGADFLSMTGASHGPRPR